MKYITSCLFLFLAISFQTVSAQHQLSQTKSERLFQKGTELIAHENFGAARKVFDEYLENSSPSDPRRGEAAYYIALSALSLGHRDGEKLIEQFITENPASTKASTAYFDLANFFYDEKSYSKAVQYYKKVDYPSLTLNQQNEARFKAGYSYFNLKKLTEALEQFNFVKSQNSEFAPAANYYAGFIEYSEGQYDQALIDFKKAEAHPSYSSVVPHLIANVYYKQKKYDEVINYANSVKSRKGLANASDLSMLVAESYYFKGDYKNAASAYESYLGETPGKADAPLLFRAGFANYSLNQNAKAVDYLGRASASKDSISTYASYYLGILYVKAGEKPLAINAFNNARRSSNPKIAEEATFQFAKVTFDAGRHEQAVPEFEKFLTTYPRSEHANEVKEFLAQAYVNGNNYHKAIEYIESLPRRNAQMDQAYQKATYLQGSELFNKEEYSRAILFFEKSLQYPKDNTYTALASFWAGESYSINQQYEQAIRHYTRIINLPPTTDNDVLLKTRYALGYAYYNLKDYDKALFNFKEFVNKTSKTTPNHTDALIRLADCYYVKKEYSPALETYERARAIGSPDNDYIFLQTGVINGIQKNYDASRKNFTLLIQGYPKSLYRDEALFQRAQFEIELGNYKAAIDGLSKLITESPNSKFLPYAYMRRAASAFNLKQYDRTISDYTTLISQFPAHPLAQQALLPLQEALTIAGRSGEFEQHYAKFKQANPDNKNLEQIDFETAKSLYFDQQYQRSFEKLNAFITAYPESSRLPEATYYAGESLYRMKELARSLPFYEDLSNDESFQMANRVEGRLAEIKFKLGKYEDAISHFRKLEDVATNKKELYNAWSGLMESFFLLAQYDSVSTYARLILDQGAVNASAQNKASLYLGKAAFSKGDYETAKDEFLNTVNTAQDEYGAEAKYLLAEIFYLQKEYKQSYETLISLNKDFEAYEEWVGKSYLLLADNFIAMDDEFNARATLTSLVEHFPSEGVKNEARKKLLELEEAEKRQVDSTETDSLNNTSN